MINAVFLGLNALLLMAIWNLMLKKTILDHYRDQLFDLRDEVREFFIKSDIPLDSPAYKNLRDLLNAHLRFTERMSLVRFVCLELEIRTNSGLQDYLKAEIENRFANPNKELKEYIRQVREKSRTILLDYMVNSSGMSWVVAIAISPLVIAWKLIQTAKGLMKTGFNAFADGLGGLLKSLGSVLRFLLAINSPFKKTLKRDLLEECSYRMGAAKGEYAGAGC